MPSPVLDVEDLHTVLRVRGGAFPAVHGVGLQVWLGQTLALVGESGSGKSVTSLSLMRLLSPRLGGVQRGRIQLRCKDGQTRDLTRLDEEGMRRLRGHDLAMVFQEPMTSLNPVYTVGEQIAEPLRIHLGHGRRQAWARATELLQRVGIPDPQRRVCQYPHELSGGMRQRVTIAMALACDPALLIADEPTTALDVTIQAQILHLLRELQRERGMGMLFVTHNLGVVAQVAQQVAVMYAGAIVEQGPVREVFGRPRHPYTRGLLKSLPRLGQATRMRRAGQPLHTIDGMVPGLTERPTGCAFAPRCAWARPACTEARPGLLPVSDGERPLHWSRCLRWRELPEDAPAADANPFAPEVAA
ncbi:ABC transporter ATP-binding protein [Pelomonas sp. CA6]|uniref:ABC transporter ATP-binding protein n=1 Tax=Pelomonas sp. CA6 TaxID=2907999 RepID=UPI001F4C5004|nr:ABC transporter ATP-binding protein [Pelomonas sp. CA6]MCH7345240.1 ABC transporter ATP-binding protein [Pelomonas sp. CA6]